MVAAVATCSQKDSARCRVTQARRAASIAAWAAMIFESAGAAKAFDRRPNAPGMQPPGRKMSTYGESMREAEDQVLLRPRRASAPPLLRPIEACDRRHRVADVAAVRTAARQRHPPGWLHEDTPASPPRRLPRSLHGERTPLRRRVADGPRRRRHPREASRGASPISTAATWPPSTAPPPIG